MAFIRRKTELTGEPVLIKYVTEEEGVYAGEQWWALLTGLVVRRRFGPIVAHCTSPEATEAAFRLLAGECGT